MELSIAIPVYNEEKNLPLLNQAIHQAMKTYCKDWDVVFVDDGSIGSLKVLEGLTVNASVRHPYQLCCSQEKC